MFAKHYIFTHLLELWSQALMEKVNTPFLILGWNVKKKGFQKNIHQAWKHAESINSDNKNTLKFLVKTVYFGNVKDIENIRLNEMRKHSHSLLH